MPRHRYSRSNAIIDSLLQQLPQLTDPSHVHFADIKHREAAINTLYSRYLESVPSGEALDLRKVRARIRFKRYQASHRIQTNPAAASSPTIEIKTERLEEPMSLTNSSNGDTDEPLRIGQLATIANDPFRPNICSPSEAESNASSIDEENKDIDLRKRLKEKEETCKEHMNKIKSLLKTNRRLCLQNKNLKRMLMTMKKKISISEGNERRLMMKVLSLINNFSK